MRITSGRHTRRGWLAAATLVVAAVGALAIWRGAQPPTLPDASCGVVVTHTLGGATQILSGSDAGADAGALRCFSAAARRCEGASIGVTEMGVDSGVGYVFVIGSGGARCPVTELSQSYGYSGGYSAGPVIPISCRLTSVTGSGVMLGCARFAVLIPSAVAAPDAGSGGLPLASCGAQVFARRVDGSTQVLSGTDPGVLACFRKAARACRSASIGITESPESGSGTGYVFRIEPGMAACYVTELRQDSGMNGAGYWTGAVTSASCRLMAVTGRGVRLRCAGRDVLVPARG